MKKGFTLVELLAVIVILAVILVIAVPQINNVIKETRKNSLGSTAKLIAAKAEEKEVENDALERNEELSCASLVKLDDNYGNCTVTKNSTTGKWEVTIVGSGKFSGYTCTGTKDNMSCTERDTNTPEYVYSFERPYYEYTYTVKEGKSEECKNWYLYDYEGYNQTDTIDEEVNTYATNVCNNSSDLDGDGSNHSTSDWFSESIDKHTDFLYEDISSFVDKSDNSKLQNAPVEDYSKLNKNVFTRWPGNAKKFDINDNPETCILMNDNITCFKRDSYSNNKLHLDEIFESSNCELHEATIPKNPYDHIEPESYSCTNDEFECETNALGYISCSYNDGSKIILCGGVSCDTVFSFTPGINPVNPVPGPKQ